MATSWKIFIISNLFQVFLATIFVVFVLYQSNISFEKSNDLLEVSIIGVLSIILAFNCINNVFLLKYLKGADTLTLKRKIFFWCLLGLFTVIVGLIVWGISEAFAEINRVDEVNTSLTLSQIVLLSGMFGFVINGVYILFLQVVLFQKIKRNYFLKSSFIVTEIGQEAVI